jgi:hypothetical protein
MPAPRAQTQGLQGSPADIRPAADFRDQSFIVRPGSLQIEPHDFASISAKFAQAGVAQQIQADDRAFSEGAIAAQDLARTAEEGRSESLKELNKLVQSGQLAEEYSPAFIIGFQRATARSLAIKANAQAEQRIQDLWEESKKNEELGIATEVPPLETILAEVHDTVYDEARQKNPSLVESFYHQDEYARTRGRSEERLASMYTELEGQARKFGMRNTLRTQLDTDTLQLIGLTQEDAAKGVAASSAWATDFVYNSTLERPFEFISSTIATNAMRVANTFVDENGGEIPEHVAVENAIEMYTRAGDIKVGSTKISSSADYWTTLQQLQTMETRRGAEADTELEKARTLDVKTFLNDPDPNSPAARIILADTPAKAQAVLDEFEEIGRAGGLEALWNEHWVARLGALQELVSDTRAMRAVSQDEQVAMVRSALRSNDVDGAEKLARGIGGTLGEKMLEEVDTYHSDIIEGVHKSTAYQEGRKEILDIATGAGLPFNGDSKELSDFAGSLFNEWKFRMEESILEAPAEDRAAVKAEWMGPKLATMKADIEARRDKMAEFSRETENEALRIANDGENPLEYLKTRGVDGVDSQQYVNIYEQYDRHNASNVAKLQKSDVSKLLLTQILDRELPDYTETKAGDFGGPVLNEAGDALIAELSTAATIELGAWLDTDEGRKARRLDDDAFQKAAYPKLREIAQRLLDERVAPEGGGGGGGSEATRAAELRKEFAEYAVDHPDMPSQAHATAERIAQAGRTAQALSTMDSDAWIALATTHGLRDGRGMFRLARHGFVEIMHLNPGGYDDLRPAQEIREINDAAGVPRLWRDSTALDDIFAEVSAPWRWYIGWHGGNYHPVQLAVLRQSYAQLPDSPRHLGAIIREQEWQRERMLPEIADLVEYEDVAVAPSTPEDGGPAIVAGGTKRQAVESTRRFAEGVLAAYAETTWVTAEEAESGYIGGVEITDWDLFHPSTVLYLQTPEDIALAEKGEHPAQARHPGIAVDVFLGMQFRLNPDSRIW